MIFDTHCHLNSEELLPRLEEVLESAKKVGVEKYLVVGWDKASSLKAIELAHQYDFIYAAIGFHPTDIEDSGPLLSGTACGGTGFPPWMSAVSG